MSQYRDIAADVSEGDTRARHAHEVARRKQGGHRTYPDTSILHVIVYSLLVAVRYLINPIRRIL